MRTIEKYNIMYKYDKKYISNEPLDEGQERL